MTSERSSPTGLQDEWKQTLASYLPMDRRYALARGQPLPERARGATLLADLSGFTPLTEQLLTLFGPRRGAEEVAYHVNQVYAALIRQIHLYGGSVIGFAGDAITCYFDGDEGLRATACALDMQAAMAAFQQLVLPTGDTISLGLKVGIASGAVRRFLVGDPTIQVQEALAGHTLTRMAAAEQVGTRGEIILDKATAKTLGTALELAGRRAGDAASAHYAVVRSLTHPVSPMPWQPDSLAEIEEERVRPWLLPTVYERLRAAQGQILTELRPVVALFLRFRGIDYDHDEAAGHNLDRFIRRVQQIVTEYDGALIDLTLGDKGSYLYLAFGAPVAHENDAVRAVQVAQLLRLLPAELGFIEPIQIGISQGTVRAGVCGSDERRAYSALGSETTLAARLMQAAAPGQILVSGRVQAMVGESSRWLSLGTYQIKGKTQEVPVFALSDGPLRLRPPLQEVRYTGPLIGREHEVRHIDACLALTLRGQGQIVGVVGEAGIGKSRLVAQVIEQAQARSLSIFAGGCQSYGMHIPYLVWQPIWRAFFDLNETAPPEAQLATLLEQADADLRPRLPLLADVLGLAIPDTPFTALLDPALRKSAREALLQECLQRRAQQEPILLILEDIHWLDPLSHDLLDAIGRLCQSLPVLLLLAYRPPDLLDVGPRVRALPHFSELALGEFTTQDAGHLLKTRLAERGHLEAIPDEVVAQIMERTQGNPFYMEQLLDYLLGQGIDLANLAAFSWQTIPLSLESLILSRLDQLPERERLILKVASIIGRAFRARWLWEYYPQLGTPSWVAETLDTLARISLTARDAPEPELAYLFRHLLVQEVSYASLSSDTRARLHEQLAWYLEETMEPPPVELLVHHYLRSENVPKQRAYLRLAGEAAQATSANSTAIGYYERLLPLLETDPERIEVRLRLGEMLLLVARVKESEAHYQAALGLAEQLGDVAGVAQSQQGLGTTARYQGHFEKALAHFAQAQALWTAQENQRAVSLLLAEKGMALQRQGALAEAEAVLMESLTFARAQGDKRGIAFALNPLGNLAYFQGDYYTALDWYEESMVLYREVGDQGRMVIPLINRGLIAWRLGRWSQAQSILEEGLALAKKLGLRSSIGMSLYFMGSVAHSLGDNRRAKVIHEEVLALRQELGDRWGMALSLFSLGAGAYMEGNLEEARDRFEASLGLSRALGDRRGMAYSLNYLGFLAQTQGADAAWELQRESLALGVAIGDKSRVASSLIGMAAALAARVPPAPTEALCLLAAAKQIHIASGEVPEPAVQQAYDQAIRAIEGVDERSRAAWARGQAMTPEQAATYALTLGL